MRRFLFLVGALVAATIASASAHADAMPGLGTFPAGWVQDRYPTFTAGNIGCVFGRCDVLQFTISATDSSVNRPPAYNSTFYNTQGYQYGLGNLTSPVTLSAGLYIDPSWAATNPGNADLNRRADLWGRVTTPDNSEANAFYPIIGFSNADLTNPLSAGGTGRYRVWDPDAGTLDGWVNLGNVVVYGDWTDFTIAWDGSSFKYLIDDVLAYTDNTVGTGTIFTTTYLNQYNFYGRESDGSYQALWSNTPLREVPEPSSTLMFIGALGGLVALRRRRHHLAT